MHSRMRTTHKSTEALVTVEMLPVCPAAWDNHRPVVVSQSDIVSVQPLDCRVVQLAQLPASDGSRRNRVRLRLAEKSRVNLAPEALTLGLLLANGVGEPELRCCRALGGGIRSFKELYGDVAGVRWPLLAFIRSQAGQNSGKSRVMASRHSKADIFLVPTLSSAGIRLSAANVARAVVALNAVRHSRHNIAEQTANPEYSVLITLLISREPFFCAYPVDDGAALRVIKLLRQPCAWPMGKRRIDRVHDSGKARVGVDSDALRSFWHPFRDEAVEKVHFSRVVP